MGVTIDAKVIFYPFVRRFWPSRDPVEVSRRNHESENFFEAILGNDRVSPRIPRCDFFTSVQVS